MERIAIAALRSLLHGDRLAKRHRVAGRDIRRPTLRGLGRIASVAILGAATAWPIGVVQAAETPLSISTSTVNFGSVNVGRSVTMAVTLVNTGSTSFGPLNMFGGAPPTNEFNASQNCQATTLPPGGSCSVNYVFTPSSSRAFNDRSDFTVSATSSQVDGESFSVRLTGTGVTPITATPTSHDFGNVNVGSTATRSTVLRNTSSQPFGPLNLFGGAPPTAEFNASQNCQGVTLPANGTCMITYSLSPGSTGRFTDTSSFSVSGTLSQSDGIDFSIQLSGCGVAPGQPCPGSIATATTLSCTPNPSSPTRTVSCTARVTATGGAAVVGVVIFSVDGSDVDTKNVDAEGRARFATSTLALGRHSIVARYVPGSPNLIASASTPFEQSVIVPIATLTAVEYFHAEFGHYFVTAFPAEIALLDGGAFGGAWERTGRTFPVFQNADAGTFPVCRFFSTSFAPKSSHFYTPFPNECETVKANPAWQFEAVSFHLKLPSEHGTCPLGSAPLHRLYNNGMSGAPNHRYVTGADIVGQMVALGWAAEGLGGGVVFACIPER